MLCKDCARFLELVKETQWCRGTSWVIYQALSPLFKEGAGIHMSLSACMEICVSVMSLLVESKRKKLFSHNNSSLLCVTADYLCTAGGPSEK